MRNITLSVDDSDLAVVRRYAAEKNTTVNRLVRDYLRQLATSEDRARKARENILKLSRESTGEVGKIAWTRDDLHAR